jgi:hypothetical protein
MIRITYYKITLQKKSRNMKVMLSTYLLYVLLLVIVKLWWEQILKQALPPFSNICHSLVHFWTKPRQIKKNGGAVLLLLFPMNIRMENKEKVDTCGTLCFHRRVWISYYWHTNSSAEGPKLGKWKMENPHDGEHL